MLLRRFRRRKVVSDPVTVVSRFVDAANRHDADAIAKCLHPDFESIQPIYPSRNFRGSMQVKRNWQAIFESEPGFRLSLVRSASNEGTVWVELHGAGRDVEVAGVFIMGVEDELVRWARVYSAVVEQPAPKMAAQGPETATGDQESASVREEAEALRRLIDAGRKSDAAAAAAAAAADEPSPAEPAVPAAEPAAEPAEAVDDSEPAEAVDDSEYDDDEYDDDEYDDSDDDDSDDDDSDDDDSDDDDSDDDDSDDDDSDDDDSGDDEDEDSEENDSDEQGDSKDPATSESDGDSGDVTAVAHASSGGDSGASLGDAAADDVVGDSGAGVSEGDSGAGDPGVSGAGDIGAPGAGGLGDDESVGDAAIMQDAVGGRSGGAQSLQRLRPVLAGGGGPRHRRPAASAPLGSRRRSHR